MLTRSSILCWLLLATLVLGPSAWAQDALTDVIAPKADASETPPADPEPVVARDLASPFATMRTFIEAMSRGDRTEATTCLDLSLVQADGAEDRAQELYRVINRIALIDFGRYSRLNEVDAEGIGDRTSWRFFPPETLGAVLPHWEVSRVRAAAPDGFIELVRQSDGWRFSAETVKNAEAFWAQVRHLDAVAGIGPEELTFAERVEAMWASVAPAMVTGEFIGVPYWQWLTLFGVILVGVVLDHTVRLVLMGICVRIIRRRGEEASTATLRRTVRPFGLIVAAMLWLWAITAFGFPDAVLRILVPAVRLFATLAAVWSAFRVTDLLAEVAANKAERTHTKFDDLLIPLVRKAVKVFIFAFGLVYVANSLAVPIAPLLTGLGIGGAGFAFAAKDTLEHFFGSITVIADRPFEVGDWVTIGDTEGTVEELGFRSTRIRTFYNSLVTVPNGNLVRAVVDNYGRRKYRRWTTHLNLTYDTSPDRIEAFCEGVREIIRLHPYTRKDYYQVWVHGLGAHSIDVLVYMFFVAPEWSTELRERHRFILDVLRLADRLGVQFAFPTQTLHLEKAGDAPDEPAPPPDADAARRAEVVGRRAVRTLIADAPWRKERPEPYEFRDAEPLDGETPETQEAESQIESRVGGSA